LSKEKGGAKERELLLAKPSLQLLQGEEAPV
jgi:hypothetical protein